MSTIDLGPLLSNEEVSNGEVTNRHVPVSPESEFRFDVSSLPGLDGELELSEHIVPYSKLPEVLQQRISERVYNYVQKGFNADHILAASIAIDTTYPELLQRIALLRKAGIKVQENVNLLLWNSDKISRFLETHTGEKFEITKCEEKVNGHGLNGSSTNGHSTNGHTTNGHSQATINGIPSTNGNGRITEKNIHETVPDLTEISFKWT